MSDTKVQIQLPSHPFPDHRLVAANAARALLATDDFILLDSETDGLYGAEACEISIIDHKDNVLLDTLCQINNPAKLLEKGGKKNLCPYDLHGIHPDMLKDAPTFQEVAIKLEACLTGQRLCIFNRAFDWPIIERMHQSRGLPVPKPHKTHDIMAMFAQFVGHWSDYHQSYTFQPLPNLLNLNAHRALPDCRNTLALIHYMAAYEG